LNRADRVVDGRSGVRRWLADCTPLTRIFRRQAFRRRVIASRRIILNTNVGEGLGLTR
jgi:hypothetical protein